jgi:ribonuclease P protein component
MLKKVYRLTALSLKNPKTLQSDSFVLKTSPNDLSLSRFAFVVSKKVDKRAVARNSLKRKLRGCIEEIFDKIRTGQDFVFYLKQSGADRDGFLKEVNNVMSKGGYLK